MDDGLSSINPVSLNFDVPINSNPSDDEDDDVADALKREKQIEEELNNASFDEYIDDDDEDDSQSSGDESANLSGKRSKSYEPHKQSSSRMSKESSQSFSGNRNYSSHSQSHSLEEQSLNDKSSSFQPPFNPSSNNIRNVLNGECAQSYLNSSSRQEIALSRSLSRESYSNRNSDEHGYNYDEMHAGNSNLNSVPNSFSSQKVIEQLKSATSAANRDLGNSNNYVSNHSGQYEAKSYMNTMSSAEFSDHPADLKDEYLKLQLLYETRGSELEQIKREETRVKENFHREVKTLSLKLNLIEGEKDRLTTAVQESQKLISDFRQENNVLKGKLSALELQLSAEKEAKISAQSKLESAEVTLKSLELQINSLSRSENVVRLQSQSESVMKDLKQRHQKEALKLKEEIDQLQEKLGVKIDECENLTFKMSQLQRKCEALQLEKSEIFNKFSANLEASQRQCQKLLESGTISEVSVIKLQLQHVEVEKSKLEKQNASLKDEMRSLEDELHAVKALKVLENENQETCKDGTSTNKKQDSDQKLLNLKHELKKSLKNIQSLRKENNFCREKLNELQQQLPLWEEKAKRFEYKFYESEKKVKLIEKNLDDVSNGEYMSKLMHEKELNILKKELMEIQRKYKDIVERYKSSASNEKKLLEANMSLENKMAEMLKSHSSDKIKAVEECREKYLELHEDAVKRLKDELAAKADKELRTVCKNYENKVSELEREIKLLNNGLYDAKAQYVKVFEENSALQIKIDSMSVPKEYQEIEQNVRGEYEKKLSEMKEKIQKLGQDNFETCVKYKVEKLQEEWTKQKLNEISEFVETTKQRLDEEFQKCLEKELQKFQSEKENLILNFEENIKFLKQQSEIDQNKSNENLRESFEAKFKNEVKELKQNHKQELESMRSKFEEKIMSLETDVTILKNELSRKSGNHLEFQSLQNKFSIEKQNWEEEKLELMSKIKSLGDKMRGAAEKEKTLRERLKKHHQYTETLKTKLEEKIDGLAGENEELEHQNALQKNQLSDFEKKSRKNEHLLEQSRNNRSLLKNAECQTEELIVPRVMYLKAQNLFVECLRKISEEIKIYLANSRKRTAEQLQKALYHYHDQITSKILQDVFKDSSSHVPNIAIPHLSSNSASSSLSRNNFVSPSLLQSDFNSKLSDFAPVGLPVSGSTHRRSFLTEATIPKTVMNGKRVSDSAVRFEDISFDFVPVTDSAFMSTKMPDFLRPGGLFDLKDSLVNSSYRISPIAKI